MFHQAYHVFSGSIHDSDPFAHIMLELLAASAVGALVCAAGAALYQRLLQP
jgi:hypothetical protein